MKHIVADCYDASRFTLDDVKYVNDTINDMATSLGLDTVAPPIVVPYYYGIDEEDSGISAYLFLRGGHITIHTFPHRECYFLDLFYQDQFEEAAVRRFLRKEIPFDKELSEIKLIDRTHDRNVEHETDQTDFGPHVLAKIKVNRSIGMEEISDFLEMIVDKINMHPITRAVVIKDKPLNPKFLSGIIMIAESHIGIHYNIATKTIYFDLFSCAMFDTSGLATLLREAFGEIASYELIVRGTKYKYKRSTQLKEHVKQANSQWTKNK